MKIFPILKFFLFLYFFFPALHSAHMGLSVSWHSAKPSLYWENIARQWLNDQKIKFNAVFSSYYHVITSSPEELFSFKKTEAISPEVLLFENIKTGFGISSWFGSGKTLPSRFYYGIESKITYKKLYINDQKNNLDLFKPDEYTSYLRNIFSGDMKYSSHIIFKKNMEAALYLKLGYFPISKFMLYACFGLAFHHNLYDKFYIEMNNDIQFQRINDEASKERSAINFIQTINGKHTYTASTGHHAYASLNLNFGFDYFIKKNLFIRTEYEYKIAFSNHLKLATDIPLTSIETDLYQACNLRYQDRENYISMGIGWKL